MKLLSNNRKSEDADNKIKALIIPLNTYFFHFEKYDGTTAAQRFFTRHPKIDKFKNIKIVSGILMIIIITPIFLLYLFPVLAWYIVSNGLNKGVDKFIAFGNRFIKMMNKPPFSRKNLNNTLDVFKYKNYKLFVFYTDDMMPANIAEKEEFYKKIDDMKNHLILHDVFRAENKYSVEATIKKYNIDVRKSFFMSDGKIDLGAYPELTIG